VRTVLLIPGPGMQITAVVSCLQLQFCLEIICTVYDLHLFEVGCAWKTDMK
jgi:hypothetical protein